MSQNLSSAAVVVGALRANMDLDIAGYCSGWQTILMKYRSLFLLKIRKDVAKFVVCCSGDWRIKG